jgi:ClpP class serine protease
MYSKLQSLLSARWLINQQEVLAYFPILLSFLNGNKISYADFQDDKLKNTPIIVNAFANVAESSLLTDLNLPENSVAIIPIYGVMIASKTQELANNVLKAQANPSITAIVFLVNSPGGQVFYTDIAASIIKTCPLPKVSLVMNMAASAAMWLISGSDRILASSPLDMLGSIGVMSSFTDLSGLMKEKLGIAVTDLYATKSTLKNNQVRQLLLGNSKPIIEDMDFANTIFHNTMVANLGIAPDSEVFSGDVFYAEKAISLGLASGFSTLEKAIETASQMAASNKIKSLLTYS